MSVYSERLEVFTDKREAFPSKQQLNDLFFSLLASEVLLANKCNLGNFQTSDRSLIPCMRFRNVYLFTRIC